MISGQIDRLRTAAQTYRKMGNHSAENMLLEAADTIWQLRDDLQRANAENAKLRELVELMYGCSKGPDCDDCKRLNDGYACAYIMRELGIEVDE